MGRKSDRPVNPAQKQHKLEKQRELKRNKQRRMEMQKLRRSSTDGTKKGHKADVEIPPGSLSPPLSPEFPEGYGYGYAPQMDPVLAIPLPPSPPPESVITGSSCSYEPAPLTRFNYGVTPGPHPESSEVSVDATITGAPQLRNLREEATRFVPTSVLRNRGQKKPQVPVRQPVSVEGGSQAKSTDEAYAEFMKQIGEM